MAVPTLDYQTPPSLPASDQERTFLWEEGPEGLHVSFPAPADGARSVGCLVAMLVVVASLAVPLAVFTLWGLVNNPTDACAWSAAGIAVAASTGILWYLIVGIRGAMIPPDPVSPGVLTVGRGVLKIERTGRDRDIDVSWEVSEIADIRLCPTSDDRVFLALFSVLLLAFFPPRRDLIRVSVMLPSGQIDDVLFRASGKYWTDALEAKLRAYLRLSSPSVPS